MTAVVKSPSYAVHTGLPAVKRGDGLWQAGCSCGSSWTAAEKLPAVHERDKHLKERAREFRLLRSQLHRKTPKETAS